MTVKHAPPALGGIPRHYPDTNIKTSNASPSNIEPRGATPLQVVNSVVLIAIAVIVPTAPAAANDFLHTVK